MALIPYFLVSAYALKLAWTGETYGGPAEPRRAHLVRAGLAVVYTAFLVYAGGLKFVLLSALIYAPGTALYVWARKEQGKRVFRPTEWLLFALAVLACLVGIIGLATGYIII
jgi:arginine:ornithine antiporter / lysine permease